MDKRQKIEEQVRKFIDAKKFEFVPGKTYIPPSGKIIDADDTVSLVNAALDGWFTEGEYAKRFERDLVDYYKNTIHDVVLCNSGSSANLLAVTTITDKVFGERRAKPDDEIITVAAGFPTTLNPIIQNGLVPVFVDVDLDTFVPDMDVVENAIVEGKTKGVVLAHPLGNLFDVATLRDICNEYGVWLVEDACDALGGTYQESSAGSFGDISTLSFYPAHHITAGEGGACLIQSPMVKKVLESFRDWGRDCWCEPGKDNTCGKRFCQKFPSLPEGYDHKYIYSRIGYNLKATDLQASLLVSQLKKLDDFVARRRHNWQVLREKLDYYKKYFRFMQPIKDANPSWFGFSITVKETAPFSRNDIVQYLEEHKVGTRLMFGGNLLQQPAYKGIYHKVFQPLVNTSVIARDSFWIGCYHGITDEMLEYQLKTIDDFMDKHR